MTFRGKSVLLLLLMAMMMFTWGQSIDAEIYWNSLARSYQRWQNNAARVCVCVRACVRAWVRPRALYVGLPPAHVFSARGYNVSKVLPWLKSPNANMKCCRLQYILKNSRNRVAWSHLQTTRTATPTMQDTDGPSRPGRMKSLILGRYRYYFKKVAGSQQNGVTQSFNVYDMLKVCFWSPFRLTHFEFC